ncbi:hypothetical protein PF010_g33093 [Phytophthora fragariae]|uniref:Uncharacterized protein n=1 Tax=Phytophthora fragariae TaxID=53985 RepID=A0A6G0JDI7_9STRA|nr:hypothetical protein PF010_g33093 [Phytophthora fragariae]
MGVGRASSIQPTRASRRATVDIIKWIALTSVVISEFVVVAGPSPPGRRRVAGSPPPADCVATPGWSSLAGCWAVVSADAALVVVAGAGWLSPALGGFIVAAFVVLPAADCVVVVAEAAVVAVSSVDVSVRAALGGVPGGVIAGP